MPSDASQIRKVQAYCDEQGVFNIYFKDELGNVLASYDPKGYGEINTGKYELYPYEEIIGVYGSLPSKSSPIFKSFGLIAVTKSVVS